MFTRAISVDPDLPEAICGLANSRNSICDWAGRGAIDAELGVDDAGYMIVSAFGTEGRAGYLHRVAEITETQLKKGYQNNVGLVSSLGNLDYWTGWVEKALDEPLTGSTRARWRKLFRRFFAAFDRADKHVNEGGFVIRFAGWLARRLQYHAYKKAWGAASTGALGQLLTPNDMMYYHRFPISAFWDFGVTSVLPFHTVSVTSHPPTPIILHTSCLVFLPDDCADDSTDIASTCSTNICQRALPALAAETHLSTSSPSYSEDQCWLRV